ncbi:uncharacterized protein BXZ73DRAFT_78835, partial [Epithele typhae]|uniref:uncharacterized protein n=1 Tax=Epithele typhae TaxID=378194 RepID=UPI0020083CA3
MRLSFKSLLATTTVALSVSLNAHAHAIITPALGVSGTAVRADVQRPSTSAPCGEVDVASAFATSNAATLGADGSFTGEDGSRHVTAEVDPTGTGESFVAATVTRTATTYVVPLVSSSAGTQQVTVKLPAGTICSGTGGKCLVSFTTGAGFGNCVVVQQGGTAASTGVTGRDVASDAAAASTDATDAAATTTDASDTAAATTDASDTAAASSTAAATADAKKAAKKAAKDKKKAAKAAKKKAAAAKKKAGKKAGKKANKKKTKAAATSAAASTAAASDAAASDSAASATAASDTAASTAAATGAAVKRSAFLESQRSTRAVGSRAPAVARRAAEGAA